MTVQQFKVRFDMHPHPPPGNPDNELPLEGRSLPGVEGPIPVPPGGLVIDPSFFDMPDLNV
jgi:hypothetical protein